MGWLTLGDLGGEPLGACDPCSGGAQNPDPWIPGVRGGSISEKECLEMAARANCDPNYVPPKPMCGGVPKPDIPANVSRSGPFPKCCNDSWEWLMWDQPCPSSSYVEGRESCKKQGGMWFSSRGECVIGVAPNLPSPPLPPPSQTSTDPGTDAELEAMRREHELRMEELRQQRLALLRERQGMPFTPPTPITPTPPPPPQELPWKLVAAGVLAYVLFA